MIGRTLALVAALLLAIGEPAGATDFTIIVADESGRPVPNAVVTLEPETDDAMPAAASRLTAEKTIDQRNETFVPSVTIVPRGGRIVFANSDPTTHQVYSFSPAKQFEIVLPRGGKSSPIPFENAGVAALGCNIHDHMIAYAFVTDSPWTVLTGADGRAVLPGTPAGNYQAKVWHPKFPPGRPLPSLHAAISGETAQLTVTVKTLSSPIKSRGHAGSY